MTNSQQNVRNLIQKFRECNMPLYNMCFIIYSKALDCVSHSKLWKIMEVMGFLHRYYAENIMRAVTDNFDGGVQIGGSLVFFHTQ